MSEIQNTAVSNEDRTPARTYKRRVRNILIHKPMQREFTFALITCLMVTMLAVGFVIHSVIHDAMSGGGFRFGKITPYEILSDISYRLIFWVSIILFALLAVLEIFALLFLHRVAGPVYRFRQIFVRLNRGEIPNPIRLREGDFFTETAEQINIHAAKIQKVKEKLTILINSGIPESGARTVKEIQDLLEKKEAH